MAAEEVADLKKAHSSVCYGSSYQTEGPVYVENIPKSLVSFETFLGENSWLAGENITWAGKGLVSFRLSRRRWNSFVVLVLERQVVPALL